MRTSIIFKIAVTVAVLFLCAGDERINAEGAPNHQQASESETDHRQIQGEWKVVSAKENRAEQGIPEDVRVVIHRDTMTIHPRRGDPISLKYRLHPDSMPKAIDTTHRLEPERPIGQLGIYSLSDDELKLCLAGANEKRPANFDSNAGVLLVLKRAR